LYLVLAGEIFGRLANARVRLFTRMLPIEEFDLVKGVTRRADEHDDPTAICQIRVTAKINAWIGHLRRDAGRPLMDTASLN